MIKLLNFPINFFNRSRGINNFDHCFTLFAHQLTLQNNYKGIKINLNTQSHFYNTSKSYSSSSFSNLNDNKSKWLILISSAIALGIVGTKIYNSQKEKSFQSLDTNISENENVIKKVLYELPEEIPYLIIGAGTTGHSAYRSIRAFDPSAKVIVVGEEAYRPYLRPPLTKEFWFIDDAEMIKDLKYKQFNGKERSIFYEHEEYYCEPKELNERKHGGVALVRNLKVIKIDVEDQKVYFENGQSLKYQKCLLATGGKPKNLKVLKEAGKEVEKRTILFRNIDDFKKLNALSQSAKSIVIIGGGFIGSELACALGKKTDQNKLLKVTQIFPEKGNLGSVLPDYLSRYATEFVRKEGVEVIPNSKIVKCSYDTKTKRVILTDDNDKQHTADYVIVAVGLDPNIELAKDSGLEVDKTLGGYLVNTELEARTNLWVAGDAACFYDRKLGRRRVEHHDHATVSGRLAGDNMVGMKKPFFHQSMFWSDLGPSIAFEAIGLIDSSLPTVSVFKKLEKKTNNSNENELKVEETEVTSQKQDIPDSIDDEDLSKGVVFYLKDEIIVGVLLWNVFNKIFIAQQIINNMTTYNDYAEVAKLFKLFYSAKEVREMELKEKADNELEMEVKLEEERIRKKERELDESVERLQVITEQP